MSTASPRGTGTPRRSLWIPWLFVAMFGVIIAVNLVMALFAFDSWTGLSADDPYKRGLVHNKLQAAIARQDKLGWEIALAQTPVGNQRARLRMALKDADGQRVTWAQIQVRLVRPVAQGADFGTTLHHTGGGRYEAVVTFPHPGLWEARYRIRTAAHTLHAIRRFEVK